MTPAITRAPARRGPQGLALRFKLCILLVALLSLASYTLAEGNVALCLALWAAASAGWMVTEWRSGWGIPRWVTTILLMIMLIGLVVRAWSGMAPVSSFATFLSAVMVLKLWERRALRDYSQILTISLFLVVGAALTSNGFVVGVTFLALAPVLVITLILHQLFVGAVRVSGRVHGSDSTDWKPLRGSVLRAGSFALATALVIATGIFIAVPRGVGLLGQPPERGALGGRTTGFVSEVRLGVGGIISQSPSPVLELRLTDQTGDRLMGAPGQRYYLRGIVLDTYAQRRWTQGDRRPVRTVIHETRERGQPVRLSRDFPPKQAIIRQEVRFRSPLPPDSPVFLLYRPLQVEFTDPGVSQIVLDERTGWLKRADGSARGEYVALSAAAWEPRPDPERVREISRRGEVSFPSDRVKELARSLAREANIDPDPATRDPEQDASLARLFESYLRNTYPYTLQAPAVPLSVEPTEFFLFEAKRGHCEYFASALAALCRATGIDARVIGGYLVSEYDVERELFLVRQWDAHAWVEVNTAPGLWQVMDATPASQREALHEQGSGLSRAWRRFLEKIEVAWDTSVVAFDETTQARLIGGRERDSSGHWAERYAYRLRSIFRKTVRELGAVPTAMIPGLVVAAMGGMAAGAVWLVRRRRPAHGRGGWAFQGAARKARAELLARLEKRGHHKPEWQPLGAFMEQVAHRDRAIEPVLRDVSSKLQAATFGSSAAAATDLGEVRRQIRRIRGAR